MKKGYALLTYIKQLSLVVRNLTRQQTIQERQNFLEDHTFQYCDIKTPSNFLPSSQQPYWIPPWWNEALFGRWHDCRIFRCLIPPSFRSATSRSNWHWVVIVLSFQPSTRLNLRQPYDQILFWRCFNCPALNGSMTMDRHIAGFLIGLSFKQTYEPSAKIVNTLNTVAEENRLCTDILPPMMQSSSIPVTSARRSQDSRDPSIHFLYNLCSLSSVSLRLFLKIVP